jgi:uncharacterized membrane protein YkoI
MAVIWDRCCTRPPVPFLKRAFIWDSDKLQDNLGMPTFALRSLRNAPMALALLLAMLTSLPAVQARSRDDHERAHSAVQAGEVMPLEQVLARIAKSHPGQVMKIELEHEDGAWVYEVKLLQADGQLVKLLLDARTAQRLILNRHR